MAKDRIDAVRMNVTGGHDAGAPADSIFQFLLPCAAEAAGSRLNDPPDVGLLGGSPHGARKSHGLAVALVAPVDVSIDLQDGDRGAAGKTGDEGNGGRIIATKHDGDSTR